MEKVKIKDNYKFSFAQLFGMSWLQPLRNLIISNYMFNLLVWVEEMSKLNTYFSINESLFYPVRQHLFANFRNCPYDKLKVVIIGNEPYNSRKAIGVPFGNVYTASPNSLSPELKKIRDCVKRSIFGNRNTYFFDETLSRWTKQGVLLLNRASTADPTTSNAHEVYWNRFTREVITSISEEKDGLVFCFWGPEAAKYAEYVNPNKHKLMFYQHPTKAVENNVRWTCNHFKDINKYLAKRQKEGERIEKINW